MPNEENHDNQAAQDEHISSPKRQPLFTPDHMLPDHTEHESENTASNSTKTARADSVIEPQQANRQEPTNDVAKHSGNTPGVLILQWLTYAFWGWTLVALSWLTVLSVDYFVSQENRSDYDYSSSLGSNTFLAYALAAVIVLFLVSIVCDIVYSKFEPRRKTGAATVIMVIHAVIFALCGIGALIAGVFAFVNMLVSGDDNSSAVTAMVTAGIMTVLYGLTLLRTLHIEKIKRATQLYWVVMVLATLSIIVLGIVGPIAYTQRMKNDRAVEEGLPDIAYAINEYAQDKNQLPTSLNDAELQQSYYFESSNVKQIINKGLVKYTPKEQLNDMTTSTPNTDDDGVSIYTPNRVKTAKVNPVYHYQLCTTYDFKDTGSGYNYDDDYSYDDSSIWRSGTPKYDTTLSTAGHPAGKVCYDLQTQYAYVY